MSEWKRQVAANYARGEPEWLVRAHRPVASALIEDLGIGRGDRVLDIGAGTGAAAGLSAARGARVAAVDLSPRQVRAGAAALPGVRWAVADAEALPFAANVFSHVVSNLGVVYSPAPKAVLWEIRRVLAPGGRLAFSAHCPDGFAAKASALINRHQGVAADIPPAVGQWGRRAVVETWLADWPGRVATRRVVVPEDHASPDAFWAFSVQARPHIRRLARVLTADRRSALRRDYLGLAALHAEPAGDGFRLAHRYLLVTAAVRR